MERAVRNLQTTLILAIVGLTLNAQPRKITDVPRWSTDFVTVDNLVYFVSQDSLWRTDGTAEGTVFLKGGFDHFSEFTAFKGMLYFLSDIGPGAGWRELWRSDGTTSGTIRLKASSEHDINIIQRLGNNLYFAASDAATGHELYRTNGTVAGTAVVKDINPGSGDALVRQHEPPATFYYSAVVFENQLFFEANDGVHGKELWKTNGTSAGTVMVKDINPGAADGMAWYSPIVFDGKLYFRGVEPTHGLEPWISDGTSGGTRLFQDINPGANNFPFRYAGVADGSLYFAEIVTGEFNNYLDLWKTDGTPASTVKIERLCENAECQFDGPSLAYKDKLHFFLYQYYGTNALWGTDGTPAGTTQLYEEFLDGSIESFQVANDLMLFYETVQGNPSGFYRSDGTVSGTVDFWHFRSGYTRFFIPMANLGEQVYFADHDGAMVGSPPADAEDEFQLMQTDGFTVTPLRDIFGVSYSGTDNVVNYNDKVLFTRVDREAGSSSPKELWLYDPAAPVDTGAGKLSVETWNGISGTHVSSIPVDSPPSSTSEITIFETPQNIGDNYGSRVRGYVIPPATGNYTLWITSDDRSELWLSTDNDPGNKRKIAEVAGWTTPRQWDKYTSQKSAPINLVAGRKYYVEALLKEGTGGDHLAVGWQLPNGTLERPIPGSRLLSFESTETPPQACEGAGTIRQEFWTGVSGTRVSDIPVNEEPDFTQNISLFEGPASPVGDNYGSRIRGYICPPTSGNYVFWIAGDDQVELSLSTDDNPANKRRIAYHAGWTNPRDWTRYSTQQSVAITLNANQRYYIEALMKEGSGADHVSVGWQLPNGTLQRPIAGAHLIPFGASEPPTACEGTGTISVETWTGIDGTRVSSIPVNTTPDVTGTRALFEAPTNVGSNFGSRFRGYVCVPTTGNYTFWIASDDHSELWLSTDNDPASKRLIASVSGWTTSRQWDKYSTQQSVPIPLVAGQQYYIEALYKEDEGGDNMAVGWQLPDGTLERPIPGNRLSPFGDDASTNEAPVASITYPLDGHEENFANAVTIHVDASDPDGSISKVEYFVNGAKLGEDSTDPYEMFWSHFPEGTHQLVVIAHDNQGATASDTSTYIVDRPDCSGAGFLTWEVWPGVPGYELSDVPFDTPAQYENSQTLLDFETNQYEADDYGSRIRARLCLPMSGNYTFWIAGDDRVQLWLSEDESPENKKLIAYLNNHTGYRQYDKYSNQKSATIYLDKDIHYYIEVLHKEAGGNDHFSVGWEMPDGTMERPIPGKRLIGLDLEEQSSSVARVAEPIQDTSTDGLHQIRLYPNPTTNRKTTLSVGSGLGAPTMAKIEVISFNGKIVYTRDIDCANGCEEFLINLDDNVPPGIYMVTVVENEKRSSRRLIVK